MASPVLWQNEEQDVFLLDIPRSIEAANEAPPHRRLQSTTPLEIPFPTNEPKSASAKAKVQKQNVDSDLHAEYQDVLQPAIEAIHAAHPGAWCLPRPFTAKVTPRVKKRKLDDVVAYKSSHSNPMNQTASQEEFSDPADLIRSLSSTPVLAVPTVILNVDSASKGIIHDTRKNSLTNPSIQSISFQLSCSEQQDGNHFSFLVPPGSSFHLGDCAHTQIFWGSVHRAARRTATRARFNFILLDPPWPNSSVKRTHHTPGSTYATTPSMWDMRELLLDTQVEGKMADDCVVGLWITNKPAVRDLVLGKDGLFENWDVQLIEEWIWLKTTIHGEPVTPIDAVWRKPYEILLLGKKRQKPVVTEAIDVEPASVKRRVIVAVPDLHSRKPCLKELIELLIIGTKPYRALEVFARSLVSGWWSWGDECIKFNWDGYWCEEEETQEVAPK